MKTVILFIFALAAVNAMHPFATIENVRSINKNNHASWHASLKSPTARMSKSEFRGLLGVDLKKAINDPHNPPLKTFSKEAIAAVPESFDAREQWPKCKSMSMIRDQSNCGSCWAFGAVESMSDRECIKYGEDIILSAEDMNSCSSGGSCNGGWPSSAYNYWKSEGVVTEECRPYSLPGCDHHIPGSLNPCTGETYPTPRCNETCIDGTTDWSKDKHYASKVYTVSGEADIMAELSTNGPCEAAFDVYEDFMLYTSGIYKHVSGLYEGGHAIRILGYGEEDGTKYWICANSWNENWGEKGFFRILRGTNECGIEDMIWCGIAA